MPHSVPHERPQPYLRHLPGDYSLAKLAGCGRLFSRSRSLDARPARPGARLPSTPAGTAAGRAHDTGRTAMELRLYDTLSREKQVFKPLKPSNVRMYVCGPTV